MKFIMLPLALILNVFLASNSFATLVSCERTSNNMEGYSSFSAFESWWPKKIDLIGAEFVEAGSGSKAMVFKHSSGMKNSKDSFTQNFRLLPNNLLIGSVSSYGGYEQVSNIRYKCNINSNELRTSLASQKSSSSSNTDNTSSSSRKKGCFGGNPKACSDDDLCNRATSRSSGSPQWEASANWAPYVTEAKARKLTCGVTEKKVPSDVNIEKEKSICSELGFEAGTEKHGDCVMKLLNR